MLIVAGPVLLSPCPCLQGLVCAGLRPCARVVLVCVNGSEDAPVRLCACVLRVFACLNARGVRACFCCEHFMCGRACLVRACGQGCVRSGVHALN